MTRRKRVSGTERDALAWFQTRRDTDARSAEASAMQFRKSAIRRHFSHQSITSHCVAVAFSAAMRSAENRRAREVSREIKQSKNFLG